MTEENKYKRSAEFWRRKARRWRERNREHWNAYMREYMRKRYWSTRTQLEQDQRTNETLQRDTSDSGAI